MTSRNQRGAQAVEFALVLPFLILIIFAVLDFFLLAYNKTVITGASREAARRGIILTTAAWNPATVSQVACDYTRTMLINVGAPAITATCSNASDPQITVTPNAAPAFNTPVTVTVTYTPSGFTLGRWWGLGMGANHVGSAMTLTSSTQMNHE